MPDYQSMYAILFRAMSKAITTMQEAQQQTEEIYISNDEPIIKILPANASDKNEDGYSE